MLQRLGIAGVAGFLVMLAGLVLIAWHNLVVAAGLACIVGGLGLVVKALVGNVMRQFGML
jgi:uncharacterized membrane protein YccC